MAGPEFYFAIDLPVDETSLEMFREVAAHVLTQAGVGAAETSDVTAGLQAALASRVPAGAGSCRVTFAARGGRLDIAVASSAGQVWQATHSLA